MGNQEGPLLYDDEQLAKAAARIVDVRLKQPAGRTRAIPYTEETVVLKDEKDCAVDAEKAIQMLEEGTVL
jgi:hypothetical protein